METQQWFKSPGRLTGKTVILPGESSKAKLLEMISVPCVSLYVYTHTHTHTHTHIPPKGQEKWYDPDGKFIPIEVELPWQRLRRKMATFQMSDPVPTTVKAFSNTTSLTSNKCSWITPLDTAWEIVQVCFYYGKWMMRKYSEWHVYFLNASECFYAKSEKSKWRYMLAPKFIS